MVKSKILVVSPDVIGKRMAGPGMRYTEISRQLSKWYDVTLAVPEDSTSLAIKPTFKIKKYHELNDIATYVKSYDFVFAQSLSFQVVHAAIEHKSRIIYDLYNPLPIEALVGNIPTTEKGFIKKDAEYHELLNNLLLYSRSGSYFVCANERQQDFWIGFLAANRVFMPSRYKGQRVEELVGLLPFGMQDDDPVHHKDALRGVIKNINKNDFILFWAGGIWDWFDPLTAIRAVHSLTKSHPDIKLVFYGTIHPNKVVGEMSMTRRAIDLAKELGVYSKSVFFLEGWTPYEERSNYLLEADVAVSLHQDNLETRLSFRTRILDHFWARLPTISTKGDWFAELIDREDLGTVVDYGNVEQFSNAVLELQGKKRRDEVKKQINTIREGFRWSTLVAGNLRAYIEDARKSDEFLDLAILNPYIDYASMSLLKEDSANWQQLRDRLQFISNQPLPYRILHATKHRFKHNPHR